MTDQYRATPHQWADQEKWARDDADSSCILELRARVEELEATQHAHADTSRLSDEERRTVAKEISKPGRWQPLRPSDVGQSLRQPSPATIAECGGPCEQGFEHCDCGLLEQLNPGPAATDSLVERVAQGIAAADDEGLTNMTWNYHARAAIREIAAALIDWHDSDQLIRTAWEAGKWLEQEANQ